MDHRLLRAAVSKSLPPPEKDEERDAKFAARSVASVIKDSGEFWRRYQLARSWEQRELAIRELCGLYVELGANPHLEDSRALANCQRLLHERLQTIARRLQREETRSRSAQNPSSEAGPLDEERHSFGDFAGVTDRLAEQLGLANQLSGGPALVFAYASGQPAGLPDHGPELVRLIESTIQPDFWERNGGAGRIYYYQPLRVIVVGGTTEVHNKLENLLNGLRRLDRAP